MKTQKDNLFTVIEYGKLYFTVVDERLFQFIQANSQ